jgi:hypothetical protein
MLVVTAEAAELGCWPRSEEGTGIGWPAPFIDFLFHFFHF